MSMKAQAAAESEAAVNIVADAIEWAMTHDGSVHDSRIRITISVTRIGSEVENLAIVHTATGEIDLSSFPDEEEGVYRREDGKLKFIPHEKP